MSYKNNEQTSVISDGSHASSVSNETSQNFTSSGSERPGLLEIIRDLSLTKNPHREDEARNFLSEIDKRVTDKSFFGNADWHVEMFHLKSIKDSSAVIIENKAIVLIMADTNRLDKYVPTVFLKKKAHEELVKERTGVQILMNLVIAPEDYACAERFVNYIRRAFVATLSKKQVLLGDVLKDFTLTVSSDSSSYESAYAQLSPHAIPLRHDLCLTLYVTPRSESRICDNLTVPEEEAYYGNAIQSGEQMFATIAGYVEFIKDHPLESKYMPVVHISEILSENLDKALIPFFLKLAMSRFIDNGKWLEYCRDCQFVDQIIRGCKFKNKINFGALFPDENGNPSVLNNYEDFDKAAAVAFDNVQLVLDVTDGRAAMPGLVELFSSDTDMSESNICTHDISPDRINCQFYRGYCRHYNDVFDSAKADFLYEYSNNPSKALRDYQGLLIQNTSEDRAREVSKFETDVQFYFTTDVVGLTPDLLEDLYDSMMSQNVLHVADLKDIFSSDSL